MEEAIRALDDEAAVRVLRTVAGPHVEAGACETELTAELRGALAEGLEVGAVAGPVSEGELARQALLVLAQDPANREGILAVIDGPPARHFEAVTAVAAVAVVTAALVVLQTRVHFERGPDGKWTLLIDKPSASDGLLKELGAKLLGFL